MIEPRSRTRRVLGVDPGLARVGWGVVDEIDGRLQLVEYGAVCTGRDQARAERLLAIYEGLQAVVDRHGPEVLAVEEVFQSRSPLSALKAGEGRGACLLAGATRDLRVVEYGPSAIKMAVTGNGRAAKVQIQAMVQRLLDLPGLPRPHDAADALAVAITHLHRDRGSLRIAPR